jgi:hypothetical protein
MTFREHVEASNKVRKNLQALGSSSGCSSICSAHLPETSEHMVTSKVALFQRQQEEVYDHMDDIDESNKGGELVDKGKGRKEDDIELEETVSVVATIINKDVGHKENVHIFSKARLLELYGQRC